MSGKIIALFTALVVTMAAIAGTVVVFIMEAPYMAIEISGRINNSVGVSKTAEFDVTGGIEILGLKTPDDVTISEDSNSITIQYYNPDAYLSSDDGGDSSWTPTDEQLEVATELYKQLREEGFSEVAACAVLGNIQAESSMNVKSHQAGGPGRGLCQWEEGTGRFNSLLSIAEELGTTWEDPKAQSKQILKELKSESTWISCLRNCHSAGAPVNYCDRYKESLDHSGYTVDDIKAETNLENATIIVCCHFERPGIPHMDNRIKYAKAYYSIFGSGSIGVRANIRGTIDRDTLVDIPDKNEKGWKCTFTGSINGWPVKAEGWAKETSVAQSGGQGSYIEVNTTGTWGVNLSSGGVGNEAIVKTALSQLGNEGGWKFIKWYGGFAPGTAWCAIFVSWCAEQNGYIENGVILKFSAVGDGVAWFKKEGLWKPYTYTPKAGDIIFFDGDGNHSSASHVGIVEKCEDGIVYTVEGNYSNKVCQCEYPVGGKDILGYGTPRY